MVISCLAILAVPTLGFICLRGSRLGESLVDVVAAARRGDTERSVTSLGFRSGEDGACGLARSGDPEVGMCGRGRSGEARVAGRLRSGDDVCAALGAVRRVRSGELD